MTSIGFFTRQKMIDITIKKLSKLLNISERRLRQQATKEDWPTNENCPHDKEGRRFLINKLPIKIKNRLIQAQESFYQKNIILPPQRADLSLSQAKSLIQQWNDAPKWRRHVAECRFQLLEVFDKIPKKDGRKLAMDRFVNDFNGRNNSLNISTQVYEIIGKISRPTFYNYQKAYNRHGLTGLLPRGKGRPRGVWTADFESYMKGLLAKNPDMRAIRVWDFLCNKFQGPGVALPSQKTVRRRVQKWKVENPSTYTYMRDPDQWRSSYQLALGDAAQKAEYFLDVLEFDSSPADVLCLDAKRYAIVAAIDIFSRKAKVLVAPTSKSTAIKGLMRSILMDWGQFNRMVVDHGKDYLSMDVRIVCDALGIQLKPTLKFSPWLKSFIERFFRSLSMGLFENLSGYIGHNVAERKAIEARRSFAERFMQKGDLIEIGFTKGGPPGLRGGSGPRLLDLLLAPVGYPTVQKKGIYYQSGIYLAPELGDFVREKVEIRLDLQDAGRIYVFDASRRFICLAEDASVSGLTVEEINQARKAQKRKVVEKARALKSLAREVGDPMADLLESRRTQSGQLKAFHPVEQVTGGLVEEVAKALKADKIKSTLAKDLNQKIVPIHNDPPFFYSMLEKYKYLIQQQKIRKLTQREQGVVEGYEATEEYYKIFVMPFS